MKCTYALSSKLPSFFDRKYFSCGQGCLTRNIGDMCEEESLIIETVQKTLTPLLERAINASSINGRFMKVFENSHLDDEVAKKFKNPQVRKKMKRRKKRKPPAKCDIIRQGDVHAHKSYTLFENEFLLCNNQHLEGSETKNESVRSYDNNSYSHITSEKESAYSEAKLSTLVRKRKKLQRRKKKKQNGRFPEKNTDSSEDKECDKESITKQEVTGRDNLGSYDEDEKSIVDPVTEMVAPKTVNQDNAVCNERTKNIFVSSEYKKDVVSYAEMHKTIDVQLTRNEKEGKKLTEHKTEGLSNCVAIIPNQLKLHESGTNVNSQTNAIGIGPVLSTTAPPGSSTFSREQKRQFRKKMRNAKKSPESYVVLGLI